MTTRSLSIAAFFATSVAVHATPVTSYLLIQGPFGPAGAVETHQWKIYNDSANSGTGDDLLTAVFGSKIDTGTTHLDAYGTARPFWKAGNSSQGVGYYYHSGFQAFVLESFTVGSVEVRQYSIDEPPPSLYRSWSYYVAGGGGLYASPTFEPGDYPDGAWGFSNDGFETRTVDAGSFDGWVFGPAYPEPSASINGTENEPLVANFASASLVKAGPGILTLTGTQNYSSLTTRGGTTNLDTTLGTGTSTIHAHATLNVSVSQTLEALHIGTAAAAPPLTALTATPEPSGSVLFMLGAAALAARRRRIQ